MKSKSFNWEETKQLSIFQILLAYALPSGFAFVGFRFVHPMLVNNGIPVLILDLVTITVNQSHFLDNCG